MTELVYRAKKDRRGEISYDVVDNHNKKKGKSYDVVFETKSFKELQSYVMTKGLVKNQ